MRERIIGGYPYYDRDARLCMEGKRGKLSNPGKVVEWGGRVFTEDSQGKLVPAEGSDVQKARILFQARE